jgi:hypothetical protein
MRRLSLLAVSALCACNALLGIDRRHPIGSRAATQCHRLGSAGTPRFARAPAVLTCASESAVPFAACSRSCVLSVEDLELKPDA